MADLQKFIEELRAKVSIVDVVGAKVKLVRKGREYQACCPFHNEKTPSFTVNEAKGFYHCFGCGAHGDIVKFEMEANGLPFLEALKKLADRAGIPMPQLSHENREKAEERKRDRRDNSDEPHEWVSDSGNATLADLLKGIDFKFDDEENK